MRFAVKVQFRITIDDESDGDERPDAVSLPHADTERADPDTYDPDGLKITAGFRPPAGKIA